MNFDANTIDTATRQKVQALMAKTPDAFDGERMKKINQAAAPLAVWVKACVSYATVCETIRPLRQQFEDASRQLDGARTRVKQCQQELQNLDTEVQKLKERFAKTTQEAETLKVALARTTEILGSAQSLLGKLSGEKGRWESQVKTLSTGLDALTYNAMLAAAFTAYLGGSPEDARREALKEWREKTGQQGWEFMQFMSTESEFLQWKAEGLPSDNSIHGEFSGDSQLYAGTVHHRSKWIGDTVAEDTSRGLRRLRRRTNLVENPLLRIRLPAEAVG